MRRYASGLLSAGWSALLALGMGEPANAFSVSETYSDTFSCDNNGLHSFAHELGTGAAFPLDESITLSSIVGFSGTVCGFLGDPVTDHLVTIVNTSGRRWQDLFFVADFFVANEDGVVAVVPGLRAFKIDAVGNNDSLVESMAADGIFEAGESWTFALIGFQTEAGPAIPNFGSLGVGSTDTGSNASILGNPAPTSMPLVGMGLVGIALVGVGLVLLSRPKHGGSRHSAPVARPGPA